MKQKWLVTTATDAIHSGSYQEMMTRKIELEGGLTPLNWFLQMKNDQESLVLINFWKIN